MDNFDLKKYLVENKVTTNSKMMTEAGEDPFSFLDKYTTPVNDANPELVTKVKSMLDAYEISELEQGIDTFGEALLEYYMEYDQHWPGMPNGMANNLWDAKLLATVKAYKKGTMDIKKAVSQFRKILSNPRHYQGDKNKLTTNSQMMNEESILNFEKEAHQFPELVAKYGIQAVANALEAIYINAEDASEEAGVDADTLYLNQIDSFKEDPSDLVATVEDSL